MKKQNIGVFLGRLQPVHNGHLSAINLALSEMDKLVIILGSGCSSKTVKNPWTTEERVNMIRSCLSEADNERVAIVGAKDYLYSDNMWLSAIQNALTNVMFSLFSENKSEFLNLDEQNVTLYGIKRDAKLFPKYTFKEVNVTDMTATRIRDMYFRKDSIDIQRVVPETVYEQLKSEISTPEYNRLYDEFRHIQEYKDAWSRAPFEPIFVTADAVVIKSGHILVVRRKGKLGKGLLALPGGFIHANEEVEDSCLRELREETCIKVPKDELRKRIKGYEVFGHPDRSLRGRTITHAFCIDLGSGDLPKVKGDDDAEHAWWMPISEALAKEEKFFEDHLDIIRCFVNRY